MLRVKVPSGALSSEQARKACEISDLYADRLLHLTVRNSLELHGVKREDLAEAARMLASVGLTSRGACGGAVRGISCATPFGEPYARVQVLARRLHRIFTGNPRFEGLPRKFKVGVEAGYEGSRHLIQDVGLVFVGTEGGEPLYDVWAAGGLGREPMEAQLLETRVQEERIYPLVEAAVRVHAKHSPKGRRLKYLVRDLGIEGFRSLLRENLLGPDRLEITDAWPKNVTQASGTEPARVEARLFGGQVSTEAFRRLAELGACYAGGFLVLTAHQNVAFLLADPGTAASARKELADAGFPGTSVEEQMAFQVCPGSHECRLGLSPTRDVARAVVRAVGPRGKALTWAISGCPNSCSQPQLADVGIVTARSRKAEDGERHPLFDLYRREGPGFGQPVRQGLSVQELLEAVSAVD
ncbi:MAG: nitrite/sulfite reductase [Deltaproteobacteria bacterium]|nr:nitrite/sulfite reductase [Deltaproteobacteria bacterium]